MLDWLWWIGRLGWDFLLSLRAALSLTNIFTYLRRWSPFLLHPPNMKSDCHPSKWIYSECKWIVIRLLPPIFPASMHFPFLPIIYHPPRLPAYSTTSITSFSSKLLPNSIFLVLPRQNIFYSLKFLTAWFSFPFPFCRISLIIISGK